MKIGAISDLHGSLDDTERTLKLLEEENVDIVICPGDVLYVGPRNPMPKNYNPAKVAELINNFPKPFIFSRGNCDSEVDQMVIKYPMLQEVAYLWVDGLLIAVTHSHKVDTFPLFLRNTGANIVISGHTHKPVIEKSIFGMHFNPGSITFPKGGSKKSYGIINIKNGKYEIELKEME